MRSLSLLIGAVWLAGCDVTAPQPVTITFCANQVVGGKIAVRNDAFAFRGAGPWSVIDSPDGQTFSFEPPARMTLALTASENAISSDLRMFQLTADELRKLNCIPSNVGPLRTYTGTISGIATGRAAEIWLGSARTARTNGSFTLNNSLTGTADMVSFMRVANTAPERFIIRRGIDMPTGTVLAPLDFASTEAVEPRLSTITVTGASAAQVTPFYRLVTSGTNANLPVSLVNGVLTVAALPTTVQAPMDYYVLGVGLNSGGLTPETRTVAVRFINPADRTLPLGPALRVPSTGYSATTKPAMIRLSLPVQPEYSARADITLSQSDEGFFRSVTITQTSAYRRGAATWEFETPNPAALDMRSLQLNPDAPTSWIAYAASADFSSLFQSGIANDITVREAYRDGGVGPGPVIVPAAGREARIAPLASPFHR